MVGDFVLAVAQLDLPLVKERALETSPYPSITLRIYGEAPLQQTATYEERTPLGAIRTRRVITTRYPFTELTQCYVPLSELRDQNSPWIRIGLLGDLGERADVQLDAHYGKRECLHNAVLEQLARLKERFSEDPPLTTLRFKLALFYGATELASGMLRFDVRDHAAAVAGYARLQTYYQQRLERELPERRLPSSQLVSFETEALAAMKKLYPTPEFSPLRVSIPQADWRVNRHSKSGVILDHYVTSVVAFRRSDNTCVAMWFLCTQDYLGDRFSKETRCRQMDEPSSEVLCQNIFK